MFTRFICFINSLCIFSTLFCTSQAQEILEVMWIDVGQGDASFSKFVNLTMQRVPALIMDSGSSKNTRQRKTTIQTNIIDAVSSFFSIDMAYPKADPDLPDLYVVVTHGDEDHLYFVQDIIEELKNCTSTSLEIRFLLGGTQNDYCLNNKEGEKFFKYVTNLAQEPHYKYGPFLIENIPDTESLSLPFSSTINLNILAALKTGNKNQNSIVSQLVYDQTSITFTGDAPHSTVMHAKDNPKFKSSSTLLQLAHHGSVNEEANAPQWFQEIKAPYFVNSSGHTVYGHPHEGILRNFLNFQTSLISIPFYLVKCSNKGEISLGTDARMCIPLHSKMLYKETTYTYYAAKMPLYSTLVHGNLSFTFDHNSVLLSPPSITKWDNDIRGIGITISQPLFTKEVLKFYLKQNHSAVKLDEIGFLMLQEIKDEIVLQIGMKSLSLSQNDLGNNADHITFIEEMISSLSSSLENMILRGNHFSPEEQEHIQHRWGDGKAGLYF